MSSHHKNREIGRRQFLGTVSGVAALALIGLDRRALADDRPGTLLLDDYLGRLCYNENPLGPSPAAITAIREQAELAHRYPDWFAESLVWELADHYQVNGENITCGSGGTEILRLCAMAFAQSGKNVIVPNPTYSQFPSDAQFFGASVQYVNLRGDYVIDLEAIRDRVNGNTTAVCLTNPNNPTGTVFDMSELESFVDDLPSYVATIIDEAYLEYIPGEYRSGIELVRNNKNVIVVKTFSKVHGLAGARVGYAVGKSSYITLLRNRQYIATVSRPSLEAAKAALGDHQHIQQTVDMADSAKSYCYEQFDRLGLSFIPSQASFFMVDVGTNADPIRVELANRGYYVRTGWGMVNHLRVSTGTLEEMMKFIDALEDVLESRDRSLKPGSVDTVQLFQATPNPFNAQTRIRFFVPTLQSTRLEIFDIQGRLVRLLVDGLLPAGEHEVIWDGANGSARTVATGAYFYRLTSGKDSLIRKMLLIK